MYKCTLATLEHVDWICDVAAKRMLSEEVGKPELFNATQIEHLIKHGIAKGTMWIVLKNETPVGALGALAATSLFNPNISTLNETFWWVVPEERSGRAGLLLLNAFLKEAEKYDDATLSLLSTSNVFNESMTKRGYSLREFVFYRG